MKLLSLVEAKSLKKKENDSLIESNLRLKQVEHTLRRKLNNVKSEYRSDRLEELRKYEEFLADIQQKKSVLFKELKDIQVHINNQKEVYYGFVEKQDEFQEKMYQLEEKEKKLDLRQKFVEELERKWRQKQ